MRFRSGHDVVARDGEAGQNRGHRVSDGEIAGRGVPPQQVQEEQDRRLGLRTEPGDGLEGRPENEVRGVRGEVRGRRGPPPSSLGWIQNKGQPGGVLVGKAQQASREDSSGEGERRVVPEATLPLTGVPDRRYPPCHCQHQQGPDGRAPLRDPIQC